MIHDLGLAVEITWHFLPYILIVAVVMATILMLIKWIPIWYKRWKEMDDDWWSHFYYQCQV